MKKYLLALMCCLFALGVSARKNPVSFVSGDFSILKNPDVVLGIELDMSKAKLADSGKSWNQFIKDSGADYVRDWPDEKKKLEMYFMVTYNKKNKGGAKIDHEAEKPEYKIIVRPGVINLGNRAAAAVSMFVTSFAKGGECNIQSCDIELVKTVTTTSTSKLSSKKGKGKTTTKTSTSNKVICSYVADRVEGSSSMSETIRVGTVLNAIGKNFGKLVKSQKLEQ